MVVHTIISTGRSRYSKPSPRSQHQKSSSDTPVPMPVSALSRAFSSPAPFLVHQKSRSSTQSVSHRLSEPLSITEVRLSIDIMFSHKQCRIDSCAFVHHPRCTLACHRRHNYESDQMHCCASNSLSCCQSLGLTFTSDLPAEFLTKHQIQSSLLWKHVFAVTMVAEHSISMAVFTDVSACHLAGSS